MRQWGRRIGARIATVPTHGISEATGYSTTFRIVSQVDKSNKPITCEIVGSNPTLSTREKHGQRARPPRLGRLPARSREHFYTPLPTTLRVGEFSFGRRDFLRVAPFSLSIGNLHKIFIWSLCNLYIAIILKCDILINVKRITTRKLKTIFTKKIKITVDK